MLNLLRNIFKRNNKNKSSDELLVEFLREKREILEKEMDRSMLKYVQEFYEFAQKQQKKKKVPVSTFVSQDYEVDRQKKLEEERRLNKLPHPIELSPNSTWGGN